VSVAFTEARTRTTGVPEMWTGASSGLERKTRRFAVTVVGFEIAVVSFWNGVSVIVWWTRGTFGVGGGPKARAPAVAGVSGTSFTETCSRESTGQPLKVRHSSAANSTSACGSLSTSLRTP
jgi:hypothetical protein